MTSNSVNRNLAHLPGLDGLRAIAASIVLLWHIDRFGPVIGIRQMGYGKSEMADSAVTLFFVLSGFLITYRLLQEQRATSSIPIKNFYLRRALRIWPVYYLVIALCWSVGLVAPSAWSFQAVHDVSLPLYLVMLPQVAYAFGLGIVALLPLWSIGVEELFYLLCPWFARRPKSLVRNLVFLSVMYILLKVGLRWLELLQLYRLSRYTALSSLALGCILAHTALHRPELLRLVFSTRIQALAWLSFLSFFLFGPWHVLGPIDAEIHSLIYGILILNVSLNPDTLIRLEHPILTSIGGMSYGLYVYHLPIFLGLGYLGAEHLHRLNSPILEFGIAVILTYLTSAGFAALSYRYFESYFLSKRPPRGSF